MRKTFLWLITLVLFFSLIMNACGTQATTGGVLKIISSGGILNLGAPSAPVTAGNDLIHQAPCLETLVRFDEKGLPVPWLASDWKYSSDYKSLTVSLRKGIKFHDGTDFNAQAAKFVLDLYRTSSKAELKSISSIDVIDDNTIRLNLSYYDGQVLSSFGVRAGFMISPTAWQTKGAEWCQLNPVGTGPFKFVSYNRDVSLKYEKFDGYWQKGKPHLDAIEFIIIKDLTTASLAYRAKEASVLLNTEPKVAQELKAAGYQIAVHEISSDGIAGDSDHSDSPYSDIRVRQAVAYSIDKKALCDALGFGFWRPANQPANPRSWSYNPNVTGYSYNPQKAKELLTQAGYPNGFKTNLIYSTATSGDIYVGIQRYLKAVGIDATLVPQESGLYQKTQTTGWNNGLVRIGIPTGIGMDPGQALNMRITTASKQYISVQHPADFEALYAKAAREPDFDKRKALYYDLMKMMTDKYCMFDPIFLMIQLAVISPEVHDSDLVDKVTNLWTPEDAWLSK